MNTHAKEVVSHTLDTLAQGRRTIAVLVALVLFVLAGYGYTYQSREASKSDTDRLTACLSYYTVYASTTSKDRTAASFEATKLLRAFVADPTPATRDAYLKASAQYFRVADAKPIRLFDRNFCDDYFASHPKP